MSRLALLAALLTAGLCLGAKAKSIVPPYELVRTKNGVPVYFFPSPNVPLFEAHLSFGAGSDLDPAGRSGLALFSAGMIRRGVEGLDEDAISRHLDDIAGSVEVNVDEEDTTVAAFGLNSHAPEILGLMFRELSSPTFPAAPFERLKRNHLDSISELTDAPSALATQVLDALIFNDTLKERPASGLREDVKRITVERARDYLPSLLRTDRLRALVVGGAGHREVLDRVISGIESLGCAQCGKPVKAPKPIDWPASRVPRGAIVLVDRPGISEAHVHMGMLGPKRDVPEFYDLRVAETILSGYFASRLNLIIREKLNLTYGISAGFNFGKTVGDFSLMTSTRNEKLPDLLVEVNRILRNFAAGDATDGELAMARDFLTGSFPLGLENLYVIAGAFFNGLLNGLQPTFLDAYIDGINVVTRASLSSALRKHFRTDELKTVVVGDAKVIEPLLRKARLRYVKRDARQFL